MWDLLFFGIEKEAWRIEKNPRRLLVFAPPVSERLSEQRRLLRGHEPGFEERDLLTTIFPEDDASTEARARYGVEPGSFAVVLVGRDGTQKFRSGAPVTAPELFEKIDAMPLRRREMGGG